MPAAPWLAPALEDLPAVRWSICLRDAAGEALLEHRPDDVLPTASVGKVLLLAAAAAMVDRGTLDPARLLAREPGLRVADSGLWQHLAVDRLTVRDLAVLVAAVSDNWATNVLREPVLRGGGALAAGPRSGTALHDRVRDHRGPEHPPTLSTGSAGTLSRVVLGLDPTVLGWLRLNTDLSMVANAFGLDPLAHTAPDLGLLLANKTGTDAGVRADVGLVVPCGPDGEPDDDRAVAYAVLARWPPDLAPDDELRTRRGVLALMRRIGEQVDDWVRRPPA